MPPTLSIAVCISEEVTLSDFVTPMEILAGLEHPMMGADTGELAYTLTFDYLAPTLDPVVSVMGRKLPAVVPTLTYAEAGASGKQFDIIWVPAGEKNPALVGNSTLTATTQVRSRTKFHRRKLRS
jgi:putative intracellular protease/amidase